MEHDFGVQTSSRRLTANPSFNNHDNAFEHHLEPDDIGKTRLCFKLITWQKYAPKKAIASSTLDLSSVDISKKTSIGMSLSAYTMVSSLSFYQLRI